MKCPKNFDKVTHQQTLTEIWFDKKRTSLEANIEDKNSQTKKFKSPKIISPSKSTNSMTATASNQITEFENSSDDNDIAQNSEDTCKYKFRNKIDKTLGRRSKTPLSTPKKLSDFQLLDSPNKKMSFSEVCEVSSTVIKEEIIELLGDMKDFESIEMTHNLSDLLVNSAISSNILDCTSPPSHLLKLEPLTEDEDASTGDDQLKDPLQINEKTEEQHEKPTLIAKENKTMIAKTISKNKLKYILPTPKNLSKKKNSHAVVNKSKSINKSLKVQKAKTKMAKTKTDSLSGNFLKVLKTFKVRLRHDVPPQHMIENSAGARNLDPEQITQFEKYGPLKRGPYSKEEDKIIKENWETFCNEHNWDKNNVKPFLYMRHEGKYYISALEERKNFVRFLARGLPWRSLYSVYHRFRNMYNTSVNNGPYNASEDKTILSYMNKTSSTGLGNKCAELAKLLGRKRQSIWTRFQKLKVNYNVSTSIGAREGKEQKKMKKKKKTKLDQIRLRTKAPKQIFTDIKWTSPLVKKFIDSIIEITSCEELVDLKNQKIDKTVWKTMEKKMSIGWSVLQNFWYLQLHMQLFCPTPIYLNDTKVKLIEHMYKEKLDNLEEIDWESICIHFNGITPFFLSKLFEQLSNCARKNVQVSNLSDVLEYLHKSYMPVLIEKSIDAILPKLFYHNGKIICIDKGSEKKIPNKFTTNPFYDEDES